MDNNNATTTSKSFNKKVLTSLNKSSSKIKTSSLGWALFVLSILLVGYFYQKSITLSSELSYAKGNTKIEYITETKCTKSDCIDSITRLDDCSSESCLFQTFEAVEGLGKLTGYYYSYDAVDWGDVEVKCDGFVVTGGNKYLINNFNSWIDQGNLLNKEIEGKLIINIPKDKHFDEISATNAQNQTELTVVRRTPQARGASTCTSVVEILLVTKLP